MITINFSDINQDNRIPPRPVDLRQDNFDQLFDYTTFIYDIFSNDNKTYIIAPPATDENWSRFKEIALFDNKNISNYSSKLYKSKIQKLIIENSIKEIRINDKIYNIPKIKGLGENKVCLYTLQQNNDLEWIVDWANWYVSHHGVTDVIIYDNNSSSYTTIDIQSKLQQYVNAKIHLESITCLYGPCGVPGYWDSDFLQYAMFEHVRYYYLNNNGILINSDVDELLVSKNSQSVLNVIKENSMISYPGKWVYLSQKKEFFTHKDHDLIDENSYCNTKWTMYFKNTPDCAIPRVHHIEGEIEKMLKKEFLFLHHYNLNKETSAFSAFNYNQNRRVWKNRELKSYSLNNLHLDYYAENIIEKIPSWCR